jgi:hypothetical protein
MEDVDIAGVVAALPSLSAAEAAKVLASLGVRLLPSVATLRAAADAGLARAAIKALAQQPQHEGVALGGSNLLLLFANDETHALPLLVRAGGVAAALGVLRVHAAQPVVVRYACFTLAHVLRAHEPTPGCGALAKPETLDVLLRVCAEMRAQPAALASALEVVADLLQQTPQPRFTREQEARAARAAAEGLQLAVAQSSAAAASPQAAADLTYAACRVGYERLLTPAWAAVLNSTDVVSLLVRAMRAHMPVERVQCCTSHALLDLCISAARVDAAVAAGVVDACCAGLRAHPGAARTQYKALALLSRCMSMRDAADKAGVVRAFLERGGMALTAAALRTHSGSEAPPLADPTQAPGAAAALLLCSLIVHDARTMLAAGPELARALLAVPHAHLRASGKLAACACGVLSFLHEGGIPLGTQLLAAVDVALFVLRAHEEAEVVSSAVALLNFLVVSGDDAAAARQHAVSAGAPALLRAAGMTQLRARDAGVDAVCKRRGVEELAAACDACGIAVAASAGGGSGLKRCGACRVAAYCGAACQRAHWRAHKAACAAMGEERAGARAAQRAGGAGGAPSR